MTAINVFVPPDRRVGFLACDTISYGADGAMLGEGAKVWTVPHLMTAIGFRGFADLFPAVAEAVGFCRTFDEIEAALPVSMGKVREVMAKHHGVGMDCEAVVLGWSENARGMRSFVFDSKFDFAARTGDLYMAPLPSTDELAQAGALVDGRLALGNDPVAFLLRVMEAQRAMVTEPIEGVGGPLGRYIGGSAICTAVTETLIQQKIVRRWADEIAAAA